MSVKIMLGATLIVAAFLGAVAITKLNLGTEEIPITPSPPLPPSSDCPWVWDNTSGIIKRKAGSLWVMDMSTGEQVDIAPATDIYFSKGWDYPNNYSLQTEQYMSLNTANVTAAAYPVSINSYFPLANSVTGTSPNNYGITITKKDGTDVQAKCAWKDYTGTTINGINLEDSVYPGGSTVAGYGTFLHRTRYTKSYWGDGESPWTRTWNMRFSSQYVDYVDSHTIHHTITIRSMTDDSIVETLRDMDITSTGDYFYPEDILGIRPLLDTEYLIIDFSFVLNPSGLLDARTPYISFVYEDGGVSAADIWDEREWGGGFSMQLRNTTNDTQHPNGYFVYNADGDITGWKSTFDGEVIVSEADLELPPVDVGVITATSDNLGVNIPQGTAINGVEILDDIVLADIDQSTEVLGASGTTYTFNPFTTDTTYPTSGSTISAGTNQSNGIPNKFTINSTSGWNLSSTSTATFLYYQKTSSGSTNSDYIHISGYSDTSLTFPSTYNTVDLKYTPSNSGSFGSIVIKKAELVGYADNVVYATASNPTPSSIEFYNVPVGIKLKPVITYEDPNGYGYVYYNCYARFKNKDTYVPRNIPLYINARKTGTSATELSLVKSAVSAFSLQVGDDGTVSNITNP